MVMLFGNKGCCTHRAAMGTSNKAHFLSWCEMNMAGNVGLSACPYTHRMFLPVPIHPSLLSPCHTFSPFRAQGGVLGPWGEHSHEEARKCFHIWSLRKVRVDQDLKALPVPEVFVDALSPTAVIWKVGSAQSQNTTCGHCWLFIGKMMGAVGQMVVVLEGEDPAAHSPTG